MPWRRKWLGFIAMLTHVMKELIAYETWHVVTWLGGEDQDKAWLDGPIASVKGKSEALKRWTAWRNAWAKTWHRWTDATVKSKWGQDWWINKVTWWYEVDHIIVDHVCACVASTLEEMEWNAHGKGITYKAFHFTGHRWVEKCMTMFRIDGRTI